MATIAASAADPAAVIAAAEARRAALRAAAPPAAADLPLRFWRQQAHFTTPASNPDIARKAVEGGYGAARRLLERFDISPADVAAALGIAEARVTRLLEAPRSVAPLVLVDGEDAQAPREDVVRRGRASAAQVFREAAWDPATLRFYRPNGLETDWTAADLAEVLLGAGPGAVDGIVFPKAEHADEMGWLDETLAEIERHLGVPERSIRVALLVESGWAVRNLERLALAILPRLCGLVWGIADYASDVGLPVIRNDHPTADWVRMEMVNLAGAVGIPAIDTMTFDYPVADPALSTADNRRRVLDRLKRCYDDAAHGLALGMAGKWAGHPAQVLAVLLAYQAAVDPAEVEARLAEVEAYTAAVAQEQGAAIHGGGMMVDRATDRHARVVLRRAAALGALDPARALATGIISAEEAASLAPATGG